MNEKYNAMCVGIKGNAILSHFVSRSMPIASTGASVQDCRRTVEIKAEFKDTASTFLLSGSSDGKSSKS